MKTLAIYQPKGKAGEYASWACNLYTGCSNDCEYCYCKKGPLGSIWTPSPRLKKCFRDESHAYEVFVQEMEGSLEALRRDGLFFSFTTDPLLPETRALHARCIRTAIDNGIPVSILTKRADFSREKIFDILSELFFDGKAAPDRETLRLLSWGFTLTGCDGLETGATETEKRLDAMRRLHDMGFKTFASLEPVIYPYFTQAVYNQLVADGSCDMVKVGLESGRTRGEYDRHEILQLHDHIVAGPIPCYIKKSMADAVAKYRNFKNT